MDTNVVAKAIDAVWAAKDDKPRAHLGASVVGKTCERNAWFDFRWASRRRTPGRMLRLFDSGTKYEATFLELLRGLEGVTVHTMKKDKSPLRFSLLGGHFGGTLDAIATGLPEVEGWAVCEFKTHNGNNFETLSCWGVEEGMPHHYAQMQCYMGMSSLKNALYLAVNKNTEELYSETVPFDQEKFDKLVDKAKRIITAESPNGLGVGDDPPCKFCDNKQACQKKAKMVRTCRTCVNSSPIMDGKDGCFWCNNHGFTLEPTPATSVEDCCCEAYEAIEYAAFGGRRCTETTLI